LIGYWLPTIRAALNGAPEHPTLRRGAYGEDVKLLQRLLNTKDGHPTLLDVDGAFGPLVEQAVREFQSTHSLSIDGVVGPKTWAALEK
jgi:peptidoglycan hydrolase-like protein with peptidoglycan-binding domain